MFVGYDINLDNQYFNLKSNLDYFFFSVVAKDHP